MRLLFITALTALAVATPVKLEARQAKPDPNAVYIEEVTWAGTGCPPGSVAYDIRESGTLIALSYSNFVAATGPGQRAADARKNCNVRITLHFPQGWSWTVAYADVRGYARIPADCSARLGVNYFFSGQQIEVSSQSRFNGPVDNYYQLHTYSPIETVVWSDCGVTGPMLNMNTQALITCSKDATWKKCE